MKKFLSRIFKSRKAKFIGLAVASVATLTGAALAGYGPVRPTYDWNNPAERVGSLNGPVFNSFINTPVYGDERSFVDAKDSAIAQAGGFNDQVPVEDGKEYLIRVYVHNNANESTNDNPNTPAPNDGVGVAKNTKVRVKVLPGFANGHGVTGYISADNDTDKDGNVMGGELYDTVDLRNENTAFALDYVEGSAQIVNGSYPQGLQLSDEIVNGGVQIGDNAMDGNLNGCFEFQAYVNIKVRVVAKKVEFNKQVRKVNTTTYGEQTSVKPGEKVQWLITVRNDGTAPLDDVFVSDAMPPHMALVPGSVRWIYTANDGTTQDIAQNDTQLFGTGGIDFSQWTYAKNGGFYLRFDSTAKDDFEECEVTVRNLAFIRSTLHEGEEQDAADVTITKDNCEPPVSSFKCDALDVNKVNRTTFQFTAHGSVVNATINGYTFKVNGATKQDAAGNTYTLVETTPGTYTVTVQVKTSIGTTAVNASCTKTVTVEDEPKTPVYRCDLLNTPLFLSGNKYRMTTEATADGGATIKQYRYEITGNNYKVNAISNQTKGQYDHDFPGPGTYAISVTVDFTVNGATVSHTAQACTKSLTIPTPEEKCLVPGKEHLPKNSPECKVTPGTPTVLPNTGAGDVIGIFAATSVAGAFIHRYLLGRKYIG